ncbi:DUF4221 family protein [Algoriphagus antarcticus]|uniref:Uncharacterized protein DUF4221 n=1 Tax=Algoriphagus antarcticus TaxID=238540 RepID=A0A3E0DRX4_9BACT|nr:DUF4221 family protein [Algoriphagus antarcticus]REG86309.1 uncharacterized protein DUF4221 [Algoriphagus antarcticus]
MKLHGSAILFLLLISCEEKTVEVQLPTANVTPDFNYVLDTVHVDAGEEQIYLDMDLNMSDYAVNEGLLYNLTPESGRVEVINMESLTLDSVINYKLRGPNSVKQYFPFGIKKTLFGDTFFKEYRVIHKLNSAGKKIDSYELINRELSGDRLPFDTEIDGLGEISSDGAYLASFYGNFKVGGIVMGIAKINLLDKSVKLIPIDFWDQLKEYTITVDYDIGRRNSSPELKFLLLNGPDIILSTSASNELWYYDSESDSVIHKSFHSNLTANQKSGKYRQDITDQRLYMYWVKRKNDEVVFGPLVKDHKAQRFYRYSRELDSSDPQKPKYVFVLTVFDEKLDQIHEQKLQSSIPIMGKYFEGKTFVHNGSIYSFLKQPNELAFIRLKPSFENE